jgi:hypothetical protein
MSNKYFYKNIEGSYSIRRREPSHPNGYVHICWEYSLTDAKEHVKLLNKANQEQKSNE